MNSSFEVSRLPFNETGWASFVIASMYPDVFSSSLIRCCGIVFLCLATVGVINLRHTRIFVLCACLVFKLCNSHTRLVS